MLGRHSLTTLSMKFDKDNLVKKLKKNLETHKQDYKEACKEYSKQLVGILSEKLSAAKNGQEVSHHIKLTKPVEFSAEYERAISMLELSTDTEVTLDPVLYAQLVQDDWDWKDEFNNATVAYTSKKFSLSNEGV